ASLQGETLPSGRAWPADGRSKSAGEPPHGRNLTSNNSAAHPDSGGPLTVQSQCSTVAKRVDDDGADVALFRVRPCDQAVAEGRTPRGEGAADSGPLFPRPRPRDDQLPLRRVRPR